MPENKKAFPATHELDGGMDLRDYFAAKAMQAYFSDERLSWSNCDSIAGARISYKLADAMMEARKRITNE